MTRAAAAIAERVPGFAPRLGLMLGSGLGELTQRLEDRVQIPYGELPGFHVGGLAGHAGALALGRLAGQPVAIFSGRWHAYEGIEGSAITTPIRTLEALGAETLVLTNAAGSLRREAGPGSLVCLSDHINLIGFNPLAGPNDDAAGPRFPSLRDVYDPELRARLHRAADALGIDLHDGVYLAVAGPSFETPAEIRAFRTLGADLVGMSTVPEAIAARHAGLRVAAVSAVTNLAEGMGGEELSHHQTLRVAKQGAARLGPLLERFLEDLA
ncbi:MAG: purine-nucleoside phosphorylase [Solirubrobacteraceae bacterium]